MSIELPGFPELGKVGIEQMKSKPNIVVFLTDDHGQWASGAYGNRELQTPGMDWIADNGACFRHAFCPAPVCSPARASFWTGKIPSAHGVHDFVLETAEGRVSHPGILEETNLAERLKAEGYRTALCGKWHCGNPEVPHRGFDLWFTSLFGTNARFGDQCFTKNGEEVRFFGHQADRITEEAVGFLRGTAEEEAPFFLFVGLTNTHTPHKGEAAPLVEYYSRNAIFCDIPDVEYGGWNGKAKMPFPSKDSEEGRRSLAEYYAAVDMVDRQVVRVLAELESQQLLEDTVVIYTSDHGHMNGHHGLHSKANATIPCNFLEETIHVPLLVRSPGLAGRQEIANPVDHCDTFAFLLDLAGADPVEGLPGRSYLPLLQGSGKDWKTLQFCEYGNSRMVRSEVGKLIRRYPGTKGCFPDEFFDLVQDPLETINKIQDPACSETITELGQALDSFFETFETARHSGRNVSNFAEHNPAPPWSNSPD